MKKLDNVYEAVVNWNKIYIITNFPEKFNRDMINFFKWNGWIVSIDDKIDDWIESYNNIEVWEIWFYDIEWHNNYIFECVELDEGRKRINAWNDEKFIATWRFIDNNWGQSNDTIRNKWRMKFISKDKKEALAYLEDKKQKRYAQEFIKRISIESTNNFRNKLALFIYNNCIEMINQWGEISKFTFWKELSPNKIERSLNEYNITKAIFKERFKNFKTEWLLAIFK